MGSRAKRAAAPISAWRTFLHVFCYSISRTQGMLHDRVSCRAAAVLALRRKRGNGPPAPRKTRPRCVLRAVTLATLDCACAALLSTGRDTLNLCVHAKDVCCVARLLSFLKVRRATGVGSAPARPRTSTWTSPSARGARGSHHALRRVAAAAFTGKGTPQTYCSISGSFVCGFLHLSASIHIN